ncbi:MAG: HEAT repeat domain-containing protein [Planctomycetes bacterium]|nr:HEAT repeat domain-containing protein [Planctomycetota bacterium]
MVASFLTQLDSSDATEREDALLELLELDLTPHPAAVDRLEAMVLAEEELPALRLGALQGVLGADMERGFKWLFTILRQTDLDPELRWRALGVFSIVEFDDPEQQASQLSDLLDYTKDPAAMVRLHAAINLAGLDSEFEPGPVLLSLLGDEEEHVRIETLKACTSLPLSKIKIAKKAIKRMINNDPSEAVSSFAAMTLEMIR